MTFGHDSPAYRPLPRDLSRRTLFLPDPEYPYFKDGERHPFRGGSRGFDRRNAWWLGEMAMLAYVPGADLIRGALERAGFRVVELIEAAAGSRWNTRCIWAEHEDFAVACFRGTEPGDPRDYVTDLQVMTVALRGKVRVHRGFRDAFEAAGVADRLGEKVGAWTEAGRPVWVTGHSLGAALATLAGHRFREVAGVYSLGAPRVGNEEFWRSIHTPVYRVVNHVDFVTMIPAAVPGQYTHGGELKYIDSGGRLHEDVRMPGVVADRLYWPGPRWAEVAGRWMKGERDQIPMRSISDHSPLHYALHLWNNYVATAGDS